MSTLLMILYFVLGLGLLILVHEAGHFIMAKLNGIRVERFSIGFGPRLFSFKKGETEYCFSLLFFLGGYVKMTGQDDFAQETPVATTDPRSFENKPIWARMLVVLGGPSMNLFLPWLLMPIVFLIGVTQPKFLTEPPVLVGVRPGSSADKVGMQISDRIISVEGKTVDTWEGVLWELALAQGREVRLVFDRNGKPQEASLKVEKLGKEEMPDIGIHPDFFIAPQIGAVRADSPADQAGLKASDQILKLNDQEIQHWSQISEFMNQHGDKPVEVSLSREGVFHQIMVTPAVMKDADKTYYVLGIEPMLQETFRQYGFVEAFRQGSRQNVLLLTKTLEVLKNLFTLKVSVKALAGPVQIAVGTVKAAERGLGNFIFFLAFLSINLGVVNLLPLPVLDGGHVVYLLYETVFRKPLSLKLKLIFQQIGLVLLLALMVFVTINDINRQWGFGKIFSSLKNLF